MTLFGIWSGGYAVEYFHGPGHPILVILGSVVGWGAGLVMGFFILILKTAIEYQTPNDKHLE
jgi:hypothetical protein